MEPRPNPLSSPPHAGFLRRAWPRLGFPALALLLFVALANCGQAFFFPLELELREGTAWLFVLATRAGVSIYDHQQVAFLNMNHGPLDPLLKQLVAAIFPFLSPAMVTRCFVPLLPLGLCLAASRAGRTSRIAALFWGFGAYLFLLGLQPPNFLMGRSDPTALFLLAVLLWAGAAPGHASDASARRRFLAALLTGLVAAMVVLTNWRIGPAAAAALAGFAVERGLATPVSRWGPTLGLHLGGLALAGGGFFLLIFGVIFHGDWTLYYHHFFGIFSAASGWSTTQVAGLDLFPAALLLAHWPLHLLALAATLTGVAYPSRQVPRQAQLFGWLPLLVLLWLTCGFAYYLNRSGGGLWYFGAFYVLLGFHLARAVGWERIDFPWLREAFCAGLFCALPWGTTWRQAERLTDSFAPAYAFLHASREIAAGEPIHSEDVYFFKDRYEGEAIDMGDMVFKVSASGYYGPAFSATADRAFARLRAAPPRFVITDGLASPVLQQLLAQSYKPLLRVPADPAHYVGPPQTFYQLRSAPPAGR